MIKKGLLFTMMFCILFSCNTSMQAISQKYVRVAFTTVATLVGFYMGLQGEKGGICGRALSIIKSENQKKDLRKKDLRNKIISGFICAVFFGGVVYKICNITPK